MPPDLFQVIEAVDPPQDGTPPSKWRIRLINAGLSHNRNFYPKAVLHEAADKFAGVRALARDDELHVRNKGKRVRDLVGWIEKAIPVPEGLDGIFVAEAEWLREKMWNAWRMGKKDYVGFSIVASAKGRTQRTAEGVVRMIQAIPKAHFVDAIVNPSAGGEVIGLAEAEGTGPGRISAMGIEKLLKLIEAKAPDKYKALDLDNIDEDQVFSIVEGILTEAGEDTGTGGDGSADDGGAEGATTGLTAEAVNAAIAKAAEGFLEKLAAENGRRMAKRMIAEADLPEGSEKRILAVLPADKPWDEDAIAEAIADERSYLKRNTFRGPGNAVVVEGVVDELDRFKAALDGFFSGQDEVVPGTKDKQARFMSIREAYIELTGDVRVTGEVENAPKVGMTAEAAITSGTFAGALGDSIRRQMQKEYRHTPYDQWKAIADTVPVADFRTNYRPQLGGFSALASVSEGDSYAGFTTEPDDFTPSYSVTKYGATQEITLETIVNDDVGAVQRMPRAIARAAMRTLNTNVWAPIINNSNVWDGTALCAAGHGNNITTSALSPSTILAGRLAMRKQTEPQSSERLLLSPKWLAVSVDQEQAAWEYCTSPGKPILAGTQTGEIGTAGSGDRSLASTIENNQVLNFIREQGMMPLVIPHATDANDAWLIADKGDIGLIEVGFLGGQEEPELFVQDMPNVGSMFTADKLTYKVRHIYGVVVVDYRGFFMFNVA